MTNRPEEFRRSDVGISPEDELPEAKIIESKRIIGSGPVIHLEGPTETPAEGDANLELAPVDHPEEPILEPEETIEPEEVPTSIHFNDLPIAWQKHVLKRKEDGFLPAEQDVFSKQEILEATADPASRTDPEVVEKVFARSKKEKIPFDILPLKWQEILRPIYQKEIDTFGDVAIEALEKNGASAEDIKTLQQKAKELSRISDLKQRLAVPENPNPVSPTIPGRSLVDKVLVEKTQAKKTFFGRVKGWFGF